MKAPGNRPLLDRVCDALRISDDRRHRMRIVGETVGLGENDPFHVYLAAGEVVAEGLLAHRHFMATVPAQLKAATAAAANDVEQRLRLTVDKAAEGTGVLVEAKVVAAVEAFSRREHRLYWPLFALGLVAIVLVCVALGWSLADRSHLRSSVFWTEIIARGDADEWQKIIELNAHLPSSLERCFGNGGPSFEQAGGLACRVGIWLSPPQPKETHLFAQFLRDPVRFLGRTLYLIAAASGAVLTICGIALVRRVRMPR